MLRGALAVAVSLSGTLVAARACPLRPGETIRGIAVSISDGDTFTLSAQKRRMTIRLVGIDAPERSQAFGRASTANLASLIYRREVAVSVTKIDRYDRCVSRVLSGESDVSLTQLRAGLAWVYTQYVQELTPRDRVSYTNAAKRAKKSATGLWAEPAPISPWQHRRTRQSVAGSETGGQPFDALSGSPADRVIGNRRSGIYHVPGCPGWTTVARHNREPFGTEAAAIAAGYRKARNCP